MDSVAFDTSHNGIFHVASDGDEAVDSRRSGPGLHYLGPRTTIDAGHRIAWHLAGARKVLVEVLTLGRGIVLPITA
jgi:hypothetical protein